MSSSLRVLHVITGLNTGGAETALYRLLTSLRPPAFEHTVISLLPPGALSEQVAGLARLHHMGMHRGRMAPADLLRLRRLVKQVKPDVIQGWMYHANLAASVANFGLHRPVVWGIRQSLYSVDAERRNTQWVIRAERWLSGFPQKIIYNSTMGREHHQAFGFASKHGFVIPNGFDVKRFIPDPSARERVRAELDIPRDALAVGLVARVHPMKDHANFFNAASIFLRKHADTVLVVVGDGAERSNGELLQAVERARVADNVRFCGQRTDIAAVDNGLDIASSSSWGEAFPNAIAEAMACGTPCVATNVGDVPYIIGDTGIVVPPRDPEALAAGWEKLASLGAEGRKALGMRARQRVVENFSLEKNAQAYAALYSRLIENA